MNHTNRFVSITAAALILLASGFRADANQLPGTLVTGQVTAVSGTEWIKVDGRNYRIKAGSAAAKAVSKLTPGQRVDVQLNGPANTAASEVINIVLHPEQ